MRMTEPAPLAVMAAVTLTSLPATSTMPEPAVLAVTAALMRTSWAAFSVRVWAVLQVRASLTNTSLVAVIRRSDSARLVLTWAGVSSPPAPAMM